MSLNNSEWLEIVRKMDNPFDYPEFNIRCEEKGITALKIGEYAQKIGILMTAKNQYPNLSDHEAYLALISVMNQEFQDQQKSSISTQQNQKTPDLIKTGSSGCCGGGKVR